MSQRSEMAVDYFKQGYNCSQSIVLAFQDMLPEDSRTTVIKISSAFGGGMGRLREVCGTVTGMFMIIGAIYGYDNPETGEIKAELYRRVQEVAKSFETENGSIICRELLGLSVKREDPTPEPRTPDYYRRRVCPEKIGSAAEILERFLLDEKAKIK